MSEEDDYNTIAENNFNRIKELIKIEESTHRDGFIYDAYNELITNVYYAEYVGNGKYKSNCLGDLKNYENLRNDIIGSSDYDAAKSLIIEKIDNHKNCKNDKKYSKTRVNELATSKITKQPKELTFKPTSYTESYVNMITDTDTDEENDEEPENLKSIEKKKNKLRNHMNLKELKVVTYEENKVLK